jgi:hypothetical protein
MIKIVLFGRVFRMRTLISIVTVFLLFSGVVILSGQTNAPVVFESKTDTFVAYISDRSQHSPWTNSMNTTRRKPAARR